MRWCVNRWHGGTIGRHSLSHALAGVPAPSEREPGMAGTIQRTARKSEGCGRFSSPLRNSEMGTFHHSTGDTPSVSPCGRASSLREGAGKGCVPFIGVLANVRGFGRFSSPLRNSEVGTFHHSTRDTPSVSPCGLPAPSGRELGMAGAIQPGAR